MKKNYKIDELRRMRSGCTDRRLTEYYIPELDKWVKSQILRSELAKLGMSIKDYYDKYIAPATDGRVDPECDNPKCTNKTRFRGLSGYNHYCSLSCGTSVTWKGRSHSDSTKSKISKAKEGSPAPNKGKSWSPQVRYNMKIAALKAHADPNNNFISGWKGKHEDVVSTRTGKSYHLESTWESQMFRVLESSTIISTYDYENFRISWVDELGDPHTYLPDFQVFMISGEIVVYELKAKYKLKESSTRRKLLSAQRYCLARGWRFRLITELELHAELEYLNH